MEYLIGRLLMLVLLSRYSDKQVLKEYMDGKDCCIVIKVY